MHRIQVQVAELTVDMVLGPQETHHLRVLRLKVGDVVEVFDGHGTQAKATIKQLEALRATLSLCSEIETVSRETPQPVTLAIALLKGDKLADVVRAATELGAHRIQLLQTRFSDVPDIGQQKLIRLRRIAAEASRQSRRTVTPEVCDPLPLCDLTWQGQSFVAHPNAKTTLLRQLNWETPLTLVSGPEGGFSTEELERLTGNGATLISLGPRILRAETAPLALLGALAATGV